MASSTAARSLAGVVNTSSSSPTSMSSSVSSRLSPLPSSTSSPSSSSSVSVFGGGVSASVSASERSGPRGNASSTSMILRSAVTMLRLLSSLGPMGTRPRMATTLSLLLVAFFSTCAIAFASPSAASLAATPSHRRCSCSRCAGVRSPAITSASEASPSISSPSPDPSPRLGKMAPNVRSDAIITRPHSSSSASASASSPADLHASILRTACS
mmetsp:Transcript_8653/g.35009  ORF Transcript_8653/g.35009 Transcript_8653/m.35009 type:complete len:213 (+) Transcript_8653:2022-2660(+)